MAGHSDAIGRHSRGWSLTVGNDRASHCPGPGGLCPSYRTVLHLSFQHSMERLDPSEYIPFQKEKLCDDEFK